MTVNVEMEHLEQASDNADLVAPDRRPPQPGQDMFFRYEI